MSKSFERRAERMRHRNQEGNVWAGLFLLIVGGLLLARELGVLFPSWFFTWPMLLIGIGLFIGARHGFRGGGWMFPVIIGAIFLIDRMLPAIHLKPFVWPLVIMALGLLFIFRPKRRCGYWDRANETVVSQNPQGLESVPVQPGEQTHAQDFSGTDRRDYIDITSIFSGAKKNILSKNFHGGEIVNIMGGSEIDLSQSDFNGRITIDTTNIFGGTKLVVPPNWDVQSEVVAIFGGVDDKRQIHNGGIPDRNKLLVIEGTCIFGGIEIRSF